MIYIERVKELSLSRRTTLWMPCSGSEGKAPHQHYLEMNGRSPVTCCQKVCWAPKRGWTFWREISYPCWESNTGFQNHTEWAIPAQWNDHNGKYVLNTFSHCLENWSENPGRQACQHDFNHWGYMYVCRSWICLSIGAAIKFWNLSLFRESAFKMYSLFRLETTSNMNISNCI